MELEKLLKWRDDIITDICQSRNLTLSGFINKINEKYRENRRNMQRFELFSKYFMNKTVKPIGFEQKIHEIEQFLEEKLEELNKNYPLNDKNLEFCINRHGKVSILWKEEVE